MDYGIVVFSSSTTTNRAKKIASTVIKNIKVFQIPASIGIKGCSYAIKCDYEDLNKLRRLAEDYNLRIKAIYVERTENGERAYSKIY